MFEEDRKRIQALGRIAGSALQVHHAFQLQRFEAAGILRESTGRRRGRIFAYERYLGVLNEGTSTPPGP